MPAVGGQMVSRRPACRIFSPQILMLKSKECKLNLGAVALHVFQRHLGFFTEAHCPWRRGFGNGKHGGGGSDYGYLGGALPLPRSDVLKHVLSVRVQLSS